MSAGRRGRPIAVAIGLGLVLGLLPLVLERALATGATPAYPTISGPTAVSGDAGSPIALGNFATADATSGGTACGIGSFRAVMTTDAGTLTVSAGGGATVTGSSTSKTITGTLAQVDAALDSATLTSASTGTASITTTFRPADAFAAGGNDYVFSTSNGHYYRRDYNSANVTWGNARTHASNQTFCGAGGYLATITTADEFTNGLQLLAAYTDHTPYWAAGIRASDASNPAGTACTTGCTWYWDPGANAPSGEQKASFSSLSYGATSYVSPWFSRQPDNSGPALVISWGRQDEATDAYRWDDVPTTQTGISYGLAEFGDNTSYTIASVSTTVEVVTPTAWSVSDGDASTAGTTDLAFGTTGGAYSQDLDVTGGVLPFTFTVSSGSLPGGLAISATADRTVTLSGTPTAAGTFTFSITAADASSGTADPVRSFTVVITRLVMPDLAFADPRTTSISITGPPVIGGGNLMALCLTSDDAVRKFDTGTIGSSQASTTINGAILTLVNDDAYGDFVAYGVTAANLQDQFDDAGKIAISGASKFVSDFHIIVRLIPYWTGTTPTCATSNGGVVTQTVLVRSLGATFVDTAPATFT